MTPITGGSQTAFSLAGKVPSSCQQSVLNTNTPNPTDTVCVNSTNFWTQQFQFNNGLPIAGRTLFPNQIAAYAGTGGNSDYTFDPGSLGSQVLRIAIRIRRPTSSRPASTASSASKAARSFGFGVETRDDGIASACVGWLPGHG